MDQKTEPEKTTTTHQGGNRAGESADLMKRALEQIRELKAEVKALNQVQNQPIAVIATACRLPGGVHDMDGLRQALSTSQNPLKPIPPERWRHQDYLGDSHEPGKTPVSQGCFLNDIDLFDARFFNITEREAQHLDPQQRLVLEMGWELLQQAALSPNAVRNSRTGVFVGTMTQEYASLISNPVDIDMHTGTGNATSVIAGRLAYHLGLRGPTLTLDTACSSSLSSVHLAIQSLRHGECEMAIAGGVHLQLNPNAYIAESQAHMLALDGRCKTFDDKADGIGRGEGAGLVLLKPLAKAEEEGDPIIAVLRGSAMNHDGRSSGLTVPSGRAQELVLQQALDNAQIKAEQVDYIEAHGTGTSLGDPIEINALASVYCHQRDKQQPLYVGSIKTNYGHMEGAAGIGGLLKVLLMLQRGEFYSHLHLNTPNHLVDWHRLPIQVIQQQQEWSQSQRFAGVSAFGLSGTNVHIIAESYQDERQQKPDQIYNDAISVEGFFKLSAKSPEALTAYLHRYKAAFQQSRDNGVLIVDQLYSNNLAVADFDYRFACVGNSVNQLVAAIDLALTKPILSVGGSPHTLFLFTGQGAQHPKMALGLYQHFPEFAAWVDRAQNLLLAEFGMDLLALLYGEQTHLLDDTEFTQPALYVVEFALADLWRQWGLVADVVIGHSVGEYAAAAYAGVFSFEQGLRLIANRARLMQALPQTGGMVSIALPIEDVLPLLGDISDRVSVAAINGPSQCVLSGDKSALEWVCQCLESSVHYQWLKVSHAFHSPLMESMLSDFRRVVENIRSENPFAKPSIPVLSNVSGHYAGADIQSTDYWVRHIRQPVLFKTGLETVLAQWSEGQQECHSILLEIGPKSTLLGLARAMTMGLPIEPALVASLKPGDQYPLNGILSAVAQVYQAGVDLDWRQFTQMLYRQLGTSFGKRCPIPTYPFQRQSYWIKSSSGPAIKLNNNLRSAYHPLLHQALASPLLAKGEQLFLTQAPLTVLPWLAKHEVGGHALLPAAAFIDMALMLARQTSLTHACVEDFQIFHPLVLDAERDLNLQLQTILRPSSEGNYEMQVFSGVADDAHQVERWTQHMSCLITSSVSGSISGPLLPQQFDPNGFKGETLDCEQLYQRFHQQGIDYGQPFQVIEQLLIGPREGDRQEVLARLELNNDLTRLNHLSLQQDFICHPILLDGGLQMVAALFMHSSLDDIHQPRKLYLPVGLRQVSLGSKMSHHQLDQAGCRWCRLSADHSKIDSDGLVVDLNFYDQSGELLIQLTELRYQVVDFNTLLNTFNNLLSREKAFEQAILQDCYEPRWRPINNVESRLGLSSKHAIQDQFIVLGNDLQAINLMVACYNKLGLQVEGLVYSEQSKEALIKLLEGTNLLNITYLAGDNENISLEAIQRQCLALQDLICLAEKQAEPLQLTLVTNHGVAITEKETVSPVHGALMALAQTIALEYPDWKLQWLDCDIYQDGVATSVVDLCLSMDGETFTKLALRGEQWYELEYKPVELDTLYEQSIDERIECDIDREKAYLITGGLGYIGFALAEWLVQQGANYLILTARQAGDDNKLLEYHLQKLSQWQASGVTIQRVSCDISNPNSVTILNKALQGGPELDGIFHCAGVLADSLITRMTEDQWKEALAPKVAGLIHLDQLSRPYQPRYFVAFSSLVALLGSAGQGNYGAANGFMDAFMEWRRHQGLPGCSINYGPWQMQNGQTSLQGMAGASQNEQTSPLKPLTASQGFSVLAKALHSGVNQLAVLPFDYGSETVQQLRSKLKDHALAELLAHRSKPVANIEPTTDELRSLESQLQCWSRENDQSLLPAIHAYIATRINQALRQTITPAQINTSLIDLGMDSLIAMEIRHQLRRDLDLNIPIAVLLEGMSLAKLEQWLENALLERLIDSDQMAYSQVSDGSTHHSMPLSPGQKSLWFIQQLAPENYAYHVAFTARILSVLDVKALKESFYSLQQRHDVLRTTLTLENDLPVQCCWPELSMDFSAEHFSQLSSQLFSQLGDDVHSGSKEDQVNEWIATQYRQPFNMDGLAPLWRVRVLSLSPTEHVLLFVVHHIVFDAWSLWLALEELETHYCYKTGQSDKILLNEPAANYQTYLDQQQKWLEGANAQEQLDFWQQQLSGQLPVLAFPEDYPRPALQTFQGKTQHFNIDDALLTDLNRSAKDQSVTLFNLLLSCFQLALHRFCGQDDLVVGTPVSGRQQAEFAQTLGYFVNPIALRTHYQGDMLWTDFLAQSQQQLIAGLAHQDYPFALLVDRLGLSRDPSRSPVFQASFVFQQLQASKNLLGLGGLDADGQAEALDFAGLALVPFEMDQQQGQFDLTLELTQLEGRLVGALKYNAAVYDVSTIRSFQQSYLLLLQAVCQTETYHSMSLASHLPLISADDKAKVLYEWNDTHCNWADFTLSLGGHLPEECHVDDLLLSAFERHVKNHPDGLALVFDDQHLSYQELDQRANQLAHFLIDQGVGPDVPVALLLDRSFEMLIALYAVVKAGGYYVPLDPVYPADRLVDILNQCQTKIVLSQASYSNELITCYLSGIQLIELDQDGLSPFSGWPNTKPEVDLKPDHLAYCIFTSGSTGKPKGVMVSHRSICNRLYWMQQTFPLTFQDRVLQKTPYSFDVSVWELFWPLMVGTPLVIAKPEGHRDSNYLVDIIQQQAITTLHFVPSMLATFLLVPTLGCYKKLRRVFCSGEALPYDLQQQFFQHFKEGTELHNLYGPTEAAVDVSHWRCLDASRPAANEQQLSQRNLQCDRQIVPIGFPIANIELYVLDEHRQPVPIGAIGDLYIGGVGLARGYLGRPDLTAERFIPNPFCNLSDHGPESRLYKTGDLARYLPNGALEYLGRSDDQVKLRGLRIELGEIETTLRQHPGVEQCVVVLRPSPSGEQLLVAYAVARGEECSLTTADLEQHLRTTLPSFMIPSAFTILDHLPLTVSGKLDRRALPDPVFVESSHDYIAPRGELEIQLCALWSDLLKQPKVGVHDNFFKLGGDSIVGMQMVLRAKRLGIPINSALFYQYQTIAELAAHCPESIHQQRQYTADERVGELPHLPIYKWFFATYGDDLDVMDVNSPNPLTHFNQSLFLVVPSNLSVPHLRICLQKLMEQHDGLRMQVVKARNQSKLWQLNIPPFDETLHSPLKVIEGLEAGHTNIEPLLTALAAQQQARLSWDQLFRVVYIPLGDAPGRLLFVAHHLLVDGVSWRNILADLQVWYSQLTSQLDATTLEPLVDLPVVPLRYWAQHFCQLTETDNLEQQFGFWAEQLADGLGLPSDYDVSGSASLDGTPLESVPLEGTPLEGNSATAQCSLSKDVTHQLLVTCHEAYGTQVTDLLLTALLRVIANWCGDQQLLLDMESHGRDPITDSSGVVIDPAATVGWFTQIYPVTLTLPDAGTNAGPEVENDVPFENLGYQLVHIKEQLRAIPNNGRDFGLLKQHLQAKGDEDRYQQLNMVPEVRFNYLGQFDQLLNGQLWQGFAPEEVGPLRSALLPLPYLFDLNLLVNEGRLTVLWQYSRQEFSAATVEGLVADYKRELENLIRYCVEQEGVTRSASDFKAAKIDGRQLQALMKQVDKHVGASVTEDFE